MILSFSRWPWWLPFPFHMHLFVTLSPYDFTRVNGSFFVCFGTMRWASRLPFWQPLYVEKVWSMFMSQSFLTWSLIYYGLVVSIMVEVSCFFFKLRNVVKDKGSSKPRKEMVGRRESGGGGLHYSLLCLVLSWIKKKEFCLWIRKVGCLVFLVLARKVARIHATRGRGLVCFPLTREKRKSKPG